MFTSIVYFTSLDDVHAFAGAEPEQAVIEDAARRALIRWDDRVTITRSRSISGLSDLIGRCAGLGRQAGFFGELICRRDRSSATTRPSPLAHQAAHE
jgi:hypothetical protein